jgi:NitT/TauT family transport system ATP-binding protein
VSRLKITIAEKTYQKPGEEVGHRAIAGLELAVEDGEFVCLIGPSGCGKTTMLNLIAKIDTEFSGSIQATPANPTIGYMFQEPRLLPWRTVAENIQLGLPNAQRDLPIIESLLESLGIAGCGGKFPGQLSLGMQRRAALARAFATQPGLLLMDEPFVSLDEENAHRIRQLLIKTWQAHRTTVLFVTHDIREAIELGDRVVLLTGSPTHVLEEFSIGERRESRSAEFVESFRRKLTASLKLAS